MFDADDDHYLATILLLLLLLMAWPTPAHPQAHYRFDANYALPDPKVTPGAANPSCVADLSGKPHRVRITVHGKVESVEENICASDFKTGPIRASIVNFPGMKKAACAAYGIHRCDGTIEGDHYFPIEACGCPNCQNNIFPQPMAQARIKDHSLENRIGGPKGLICQGKMTVKEAQSCIGGGWWKCAEKIQAMK